MKQCKLIPVKRDAEYKEEVERLIRGALDKFTLASSLEQENWISYYQKAKVYIHRGVFTQMYNTHDTIAVSQWNFNCASQQLFFAFKYSPDCFQKLILLAEKLYNLSHAAAGEKKIFLLLNAFYLLYAAFKEAPITPSAIHFYQAGRYLFEYLRNNGPDSGLHLSGAAGSMFEIALLHSPALTTKSYVYKLDPIPLQQPSLDDQHSVHLSSSTSLGNSGSLSSSLFTSSPSLRSSSAGTPLNESISALTQFNIHRSIYIYKKATEHQIGMEATDEMDCIHQQTIELLPEDTCLHFTPFTTRNPEDNYKESHFISCLYHILGQFYSKNRTGKIFNLSYDQFILCNSAYSKFLLSRLEIFFPESASTPNKIHLIASNFPINDANIPQLLAASKNKSLFNPDCYLLATFNVDPGYNNLRINHYIPGNFFPSSFLPSPSFFLLSPFFFLLSSFLLLSSSSSFFLLPSSLSLLPCPFFLVPSSLSLLSCPFFLVPSPFSPFSLLPSLFLF